MKTIPVRRRGKNWEGEAPAEPPHEPRPQKSLPQEGIFRREGLELKA